MDLLDLLAELIRLGGALADVGSGTAGPVYVAPSVTVEGNSDVVKVLQAVGGLASACAVAVAIFGPRAIFKRQRDHEVDVDARRALVVYLEAAYKALDALDDVRGARPGDGTEIGPAFDKLRMALLTSQLFFAPASHINVLQVEVLDALHALGVHLTALMDKGTIDLEADSEKEADRAMEKISELQTASWRFARAEISRSTMSKNPPEWMREALAAGRNPSRRQRRLEADVWRGN